MKKPSAILVTALAAVGINFAASAEVNPDTGVDLEVIKANLQLDAVEGISNLQLDATKGEISYKIGDEKVVIFAGTANQHTFKVPFGVESLKYLVVAGGGSGGNNAGGGGGAGGMLEGTTVITTENENNVLTIGVGMGGAGVSSEAKSSKAVGHAGNDGLDSVLVKGLTEVARAIGGGGGGAYDNYNSNAAISGRPGGSGGGGNGAPINYAVVKGGSGTPGQGNDGGGHEGTAATQAFSGAGGGGASKGGGDSAKYGDKKGVGGDGKPCSITGGEVYYAGGGNGGISVSGSYLPGTTAKGGGGQGGANANGRFNGQPGVDGLGGGGGGGRYFQNPTTKYSSGKGGDGIVILRFTPPPESVTVTFDYDDKKCAVAVNDEQLGGAKSYDLAYGADLVVVVTPVFGYKYESAPEGWDLVEGSITKTYLKVIEGFSVQITDPVEDHDVGELVDVTIDEAEHATYEATVDGKPIGDQVEKDSVVVVVATPEEHYAYAELPADWQRVPASTAITRSFTASEDLTITIPEPEPIMVTVTVQLIDNVACVVKDGETIVPSGTEVQEGTELKVTVTPQGVYEYSAAPEGWTKNDDGTITLDLTAMEETAAIVVPSENFGKRQVTVSFVARGVTYAATNVADKAEVKSGVKLDADAQLEIVATRYSNEYIFADTLPAGWEKVDANVIKGVVTAASSIEIPVATWTPTNGELIENGGFEYFDEGEFVEKAGFPASMAGSWVGSINTAFLAYKFYGLSKTSPHSGSYSAWTAGNQGDIPYIAVSFTTPAETSDKTEFKLRYFIMQITAQQNYDGQCRLQLYQGAKVVKDLGTVESTLNSWEARTQIISNLKPLTTYTLRFGRYGVNYHNYAIDDVSLKINVKKGLALLIF